MFCGGSWHAIPGDLEAYGLCCINLTLSMLCRDKVVRSWHAIPGDLEAYGLCPVNLHTSIELDSVSVWSVVVVLREAACTLQSGVCVCC